MIEYRSFFDMNQTILRNIHRVPRDIDVVVGVPRSGIIAAGILASYLNIPYIDLGGFLSKEPLLTCLSNRIRPQDSEEAGKPRKALVVDDSLFTGETMAKARRMIEASGVAGKVIYCVVYIVPGSEDKVDLAFEGCPMPRIFEWNVMNHVILERSCIDIDGVLCRDPSPEENDDGPRYKKFIETCEPLFLPKIMIGCLVTCRLEKYRAETERWLARHSVKYGRLVMMPFQNKAARIASGSYGAFKAKVYRETGAELFIESSLNQAAEIADRSCRQVLCVEAHEMIFPSSNSIARVFLHKLPKALYKRTRFALSRTGRWFIRQTEH